MLRAAALEMPSWYVLIYFLTPSIVNETNLQEKVFAAVFSKSFSDVFFFADDRQPYQYPVHLQGLKTRFAPLVVLLLENWHCCPRALCQALAVSSFAFPKRLC